jgi:DNA-binding MarR family transcriptional regulator
LEEKEQIVLTEIRKAGKPIRPSDIAKISNLESKEISKIIKDLKKKGKIISPKRCYYSIV